MGWNHQLVSKDVLQSYNFATFAGQNGKMTTCLQSRDMNAKPAKQCWNRHCNHNATSIDRPNRWIARNPQFQQPFLGGGNSNIFLFSSRILGEDESNLTCAYFSNGLVETTNNPSKPQVRRLSILPLSASIIHQLRSVGRRVKLHSTWGPDGFGARLT